MFYTVEAFDACEVSLHSGGESVAVPISELTMLLRPAFALTYFGVQGRTLDGIVRLHDTKSPFFTRRQLAVGVGRARAADLVQVM